MKKQKALIVWGGWEGHTPEASANVVAQILLRHNFDITIETTTAAFAHSELDTYDLIVPVITMSRIDVRQFSQRTRLPVHDWWPMGCTPWRPNRLHR